MDWIPPLVWRSRRGMKRHQGHRRQSPPQFGRNLSIICFYERCSASACEAEWCEHDCHYPSDGGGKEAAA